MMGDEVGGTASSRICLHNNDRRTYRCQRSARSMTELVKMAAQLWADTSPLGNEVFAVAGGEDRERIDRNSSCLECARRRGHRHQRSAGVA